MAEDGVEKIKWIVSVIMFSLESHTIDWLGAQFLQGGESIILDKQFVEPELYGFEWESRNVEQTSQFVPGGKSVT